MRVNKLGKYWGEGEVIYRSTSLIVKKDIMNFLGEAEGEDEEAPTSPPAKKSVRHPAIADIYDAGCNIKYADNLWRRKRERERDVNDIVKNYDNDIVRKCDNDIVRKCDNDFVRKCDNDIVRKCDIDIVGKRDNDIDRKCDNDIDRMSDNDIGRMSDNDIVRKCDIEIVRKCDNYFFGSVTIILL